MNLHTEQQTAILASETMLKTLVEEINDPDKANAVGRFISHALPKADPARLADFRAILDEALPYQNYIDELLSKVETLEKFCRRKLRHELQQTYGRRFSVNDSIKLKPANDDDNDACTYSLLQAAMLNFTAEEATPGYFSSDSETAGKVDKISGAGSKPIKITAQAFATLSRQLDLGGQYQKHIARTFKVSNIELIGARLHKFNLKLAAYEKYFSNLDFPRHQLFMLSSLLKGNEDIFDGTAFNNGNIKLYSVQLFGNYLTDAILITCRQTDHSTKDSFILYIPNDPGECFYKDNSEEECKHRLGVNFIANKKLQKLIISQLTDTEQRQLQTQNLESISIVDDITFIPLKQGLCKHLFERNLNKLAADARDIAVPVANVSESFYARRRQDHALRSTSRQPRHPTHDFSNNLRTFATDELLALVFNHLSDWTAIEKHTALSRLLDLKKRLSASDTGSHSRLVDAEAADSYFRQFEVKEHSAELPGIRLEKPALSMYQSGAEIARQVLQQAVSEDDDYRVLKWNGRQYIQVDERVYEVEPDPSAWRIRHPLNAHAYGPPVVYCADNGWTVQHKAIVDQATQFAQGSEGSTSDRSATATDQSPAL
jgi:hypothetical protein